MGLKGRRTGGRRRCFGRRCRRIVACRTAGCRHSRSERESVRSRTGAPSGDVTSRHRRTLAHRLRTTHAPAQPVRPPEAAPLRAVLLDPVPGRRQRQHLQERVDHFRGVPRGQHDEPRSERARQSRRRRVHCPVHAAVGDFRPARRQVREVAAHPLHQAVRDRDHDDRPRRLLAARSHAADGRAGADGRAFDAVRAGQVRDPAAAFEARRADRRQRPGRNGHVRRDSARDDRGWTRGRDCRGGPGHRRQRRGRGRVGRVPREPWHSVHAGGGARSQDQLESVHRDLEEPALRPRQPRRLAVDARDIVVLVLRRHLPCAVPGLQQGCPRRRRARGDDSCSRCFRSASASGRCCASGSPGERSSWGWCRSGRSA